MRRHEVSDQMWSKLEILVPGRHGGHSGVAKDNRNSLDTIEFLAKTGIPWRDLPKRFGKRATICAPTRIVGFRKASTHATQLLIRPSHHFRMYNHTNPVISSLMNSARFS